jgi:exodeoxyribonuclease VII small subunit
MTAKSTKPARRKATTGTPSQPAQAAAESVTDATGFEEAMHELETLVERLEAGDLGLEESLDVFERGIGLTRACQRALDRAEQKVRVLTAESAPEQTPGPSQEAASDFGDPPV